MALFRIKQLFRLSSVERRQYNNFARSPYCLDLCLYLFMRHTSVAALPRCSALPAKRVHPNCEFNMSRKWKLAKCKYLIATMPSSESTRRTTNSKFHDIIYQALTHFWVFEGELALYIEETFRSNKATGKIPYSINFNS